MCEFEKKVFNYLSHCCGKEINSLRVGVAVSGGADSVSLLLSLSSFCKKLEVITVNHNIREESETCGDAEFVKQLCNKIGVSCSVVEIPRGKVLKQAEERGSGIEESARNLRYEIFERFISEKNLDYLCLAHNKNDELETLLMRFLSGASLEASCGIAKVRGKFIRPLLEIEREEIEKYLLLKGQTWRTDSTNADVSYLRNKIRLQLVPFLNKEFSGWKTALLSGAEKFKTDSDFILSEVEKNPVDIKNGVVSISLIEFNSLNPAIRSRWLLKACNIVSSETRIPSAFIEDFSKNPREVFYKSIQFFVKNDKIFIKKRVKSQTEIVFSDIINKEGLYNFPFGTVSVSNEKSQNDGVLRTADLSINEEIVLFEIELPCCIRSVVCDDEIECADGSLKKICDIFSNWHVSEEYKSLIPVVQKLKGNKQEIICILGSIYGYKNWIVERFVGKSIN